MKSGKKLDLSLYLVLDANLCKTPEGMAETARKADTAEHMHIKILHLNLRQQ